MYRVAQQIKPAFCLIARATKKQITADLFIIKMYVGYVHTKILNEKTFLNDIRKPRY
jgi:hypothetical protein